MIRTGAGTDVAVKEIIQILAAQKRPGQRAVFINTYSQNYLQLNMLQRVLGRSVKMIYLHREPYQVSLRTTCYMLHAAGYMMLHATCYLHAACCMLHTACCMLHAACCLLPYYATCCLPHGACCMLHHACRYAMPCYMLLATCCHMLHATPC